MAQQIRTIGEFRGFVDACEEDCERCVLHAGTEVVYTALNVVDEVLAQRQNGGMPSLDAAHLGDKVDALAGLRRCMEIAEIAVPLGHAAAIEYSNGLEDDEVVVQLDNYRK